jgi:hypothetical protein
MGEHTREVLRDVAGLSAPAIGEMLADGTAYQMSDPDVRLERPYLGWVGAVMRLSWPRRREAW